MEATAERAAARAPTRLTSPAAADRLGVDLGAVSKGVGSAGEGKEGGCEAMRDRAGGGKVAMPTAAVNEVAPDDDLKVGDVRPGAGGAADQGHQHGAEGAGAVVDAERDDEGNRGVLGFDSKWP